jgi:hypothetical protein
MSITISPDVLERLEGFTLAKGGHRSFEEGACAMELAAHIAGEEHSDKPRCVSPVIAAFMRSWNDDLEDAPRQKLKTLIPLMIGTNTGEAGDEIRAWMATDWLVRVHTPAFLRLAELTEHANRLASLSPLTSSETAEAAQPTIEEARSASAAAWAAASAAARDAARAAARDAARDAASAAAWAAARAAASAAARAAARDAARAAARDAASAAAWAAGYSAAYAAARQKMDAVVTELQDSAMVLVARMCAVGRSEVPA